MRAANELQPHGQTISGYATGQRDSWATGEGDDERQKHPIDVGGELFARDLGWKTLLHRKGGYSNGWAGQQIKIVKEARDTMKKRIPVALRLDNLWRGESLAPLN